MKSFHRCKNKSLSNYCSQTVSFKPHMETSLQFAVFVVVKHVHILQFDHPTTSEHSNGSDAGGYLQSRVSHGKPHYTLKR